MLVPGQRKLPPYIVKINNGTIKQLILDLAFFIINLGEMAAWIGVLLVPTIYL